MMEGVGVMPTLKSREHVVTSETRLNIKEGWARKQGRLTASMTHRDVISVNRQENGSKGGSQGDEPFGRFQWETSL